MAKVKKMAFGGMSGMGASRPPMAGNKPPAGANLMQKYNGPPSTPPMQSRMQQMQQMQPRGAMGGNQAPAGSNLMQKYNGPPPPKPGSPEMAEAIKNTEMMKSMGFSNPGGTPTGPNAFDVVKQNAGAVNNMVGAAAGAGKPMKKGGVIKSSASARGDGIAKRGKTRGKIV